MEKIAVRMLSVILLLFAPQSVPASFPLIQNPLNRQYTTLNGKWNYIVDVYETGYSDYRDIPYDESRKEISRNYSGFYTNAKPKDRSERVEYDFDRSPTLLVPRDWNSQRENLFYYEGTVWYKKSFDYIKSNPDHRLFIHFGGINYRADVYLNGYKLGVHKGGFTPFNYEITDLIREKDNFLIVKVDNKRGREEVPTLKTDWWNYGGITRDVGIIETPASFIIDYFLQLEKGTADMLSGYVQLDGPEAAGKEVSISIPDLQLEMKMITDKDGKATVHRKVRKLVRWTPEDPKLYKVLLASPADQISDRIGFRSIETQGMDILLNGQSVFLRGICMHEENPLRGGRAATLEDARMLLTWAKELGCNFVRLAHYPHNEYMPRLADEMGLLVWEEIPVYWMIQWENDGTFQNAANQLREVVTRDKNRASIIIWSMANETPVNDSRVRFLHGLVTLTRGLDNTRLISAALERSSKPDDPMVQWIHDPFAEQVDVLSFNEYIGWYDGLPEKCAQISWQIDQQKPVIISEFGADALQGFHGDKLTRWSEEYQENLYRETLAMLRKIPQLRGITPWILADFRSPRRNLPGIQDGWNRKGLISETGVKKKAYYLLKSVYQEMAQMGRTLAGLQDSTGVR
jgi:beta-glucuronidase